MPAKRAYAPGIDGLRALAVLAVFAYHAGGLRGGFLGVDVFFVISGYLITDILARQRRTGSWDLRQFWIRRARRLLPALAVMLVSVTAGTVLFDRTQLTGLRGDLLAAATYTSNWHQIAAHDSYFARFGPQPILVHLWSLAVEEQFYLVWPLILLALLAIITLPGRQLGIVLAAAFGSALAMALEFSPTGDPSRLYYGTDTHAVGLLVGAALALGLAGRRPRSGRLGLVCLIGLAISLFLIDDSGAFVYRGGFLLVSLLAAGAVLGVASGPLGRVLGMRPLRWLGVRSYAVYLWHWPVLCMVRARLGHQPVFLGSAAEFAFVLVIAHLSYLYVEDPIRRRGFAATIRSAIDALRVRSAPRLAAGGSAAAVALIACIGLALPAPKDAVKAQIQAGIKAAARPPAHRPAAAHHIPGTGVTAVGDSVLLASATALKSALPGITIDAKVGRQLSDANTIVAMLRARHRLGPVVLLDLGTNGSFSAASLARLMHTIGPSRTVLMLTVYAPRPWETTVNRAIRAAPRHWPNVRIVDWYTAIRHRQQLLWTDHVHPRPDGARLYTRLVLAALPKSVR